MALSVTISSITGSSPFDIYICQSDGTGCFYINEISSTPYTFDIPVPYDTSTSYIVKVVDAEGCIITSTQTPSDTPTQTPSDTPTQTPSDTPTQTPTSTSGATPTQTASQTQTPTHSPTQTPSDTPTQTPTYTPTHSPTQTQTPTHSPTQTPSDTPTQTPTITPPPNTTWYFNHGTGTSCTASFLEILRNGTQVVLATNSSGGSSGTLTLNVGDVITIRVDTGNQLSPVGCSNAYAKYDSQQLVQLQEVGFNNVEIFATVTLNDINYGITICGTIGGGFCPS